MKFTDLLEKEYEALYESMLTGAFWISPSGEIYAPSQYHITDVVTHPEKFGVTRAWVDSIFAKHGEPVGSEGDAREEIIGELLKKGWTRLRKYRNYWSVTVWRLTPKLKSIIQQWATAILKGVNGMRETDKFIDVKIVEIQGKAHVGNSLSDIANHRLEENEQVDEVKLKWVDSVRDLPDLPTEE